MVGIAQPNCDLKRDVDGIRVYTCKETDEKIQIAAGGVWIGAGYQHPAERLLWDVGNYNTWQYNLMEASAIDSITENTMAYRALIDAPWPVDNREIVVKMVAQETPEGMSIKVQTYPYSIAPPDGVIRVPYFNATWTIIKMVMDWNLLTICGSIPEARCQRG